MNIYKIFTLSFGVAQQTIVSASDIQQAIYSAGVDINSIIKIELYDTTNISKLG